MAARLLSTVPMGAAHCRGAAAVELALLAPMVCTLVLFSLLLTELSRARLKLLEAARWAGFELTSYALDDYGSLHGPRHGRALAAARSDILRRGEPRFSDLDSLGPSRRPGLLAAASDFEIRVEDRAVPVARERFDRGRLPATELDGTLAQALSHFRFNGGGLHTASVAIRLHNRILPQHFLDDREGLSAVDQWGGADLAAFRLAERFTLVASSWQLGDGSDAVMSLVHGRAGVHGDGSPHGLWLQVARMTHLGAGGQPHAPLLAGVWPHPGSSTFVVAHNYGLGEGDPRGCGRGLGSHDLRHPARAGLNNLDEASRLDVPFRKCFDTVPFREVAGYDTPRLKSLPVRQFLDRGSHFLGCSRAQADDPTAKATSGWLRGDRNARPVMCGGGR